MLLHITLLSITITITITFENFQSITITITITAKLVYYILQLHITITPSLVDTHGTKAGLAPQTIVFNCCCYN